MKSLFDNINIELPRRYMYAIWNQLDIKRKVKVNVGFNYENQKIDIIHYFASGTTHRNINWGPEVYVFLENECLKYAKETIHGLHQVKEVGDLALSEDHLVTAK
jgi:hypothetical protein